MKNEIREYIDETVRAMLEKDMLQAALVGTNFYAVTESLLRGYKKLRALVEAADDYGFEIPKKSKDISVAPPAGGGVPDWSEVQDEAIRARMRSYVRTREMFDRLDRLVAMHEKNPYFKVVRMKYFNEDYGGNDLPDNGRERTIEDIAGELEATDFRYAKSDKTLAKKKTEIVRELTVDLFGEAGAVSIEMYKARKNAKEAT